MRHIWCRTFLLYYSSVTCSLASSSLNSFACPPRENCVRVSALRWSRQRVHFRVSGLGKTTTTCIKKRRTEIKKDARRGSEAAPQLSQLVAPNLDTRLPRYFSISHCAAHNHILPSHNIMSTIFSVRAVTRPRTQDKATPIKFSPLPKKL